MQDTQAFTYSELARRLGITEGSCRNLVRRKRWGKTLGNDGQARIAVPLDALPSDTDVSTSGATSIPIDVVSHAVLPMQSNASMALNEEIASLRSALAKAEALAEERASTIERERKRADEAQAEIKSVMERLLALQEAQLMPWWKRLLRSP